MKTMKIGIKFFITILFLSFFARATECKAEETLRYDDLKNHEKSLYLCGYQRFCKKYGGVQGIYSFPAVRLFL